MKIYRKIISVSILITIIFTLNVKAEEMKAPDVKALGAVLMDEKSGRVLWEKNAFEPLANASTTKIMTCILAIESGKLDETVTASKNAAIQPKTQMGLSVGEQIKLKDLLYALMLQSSNDAAVAIAEHISGSVDDFCSLMNEKAQDIGAVDTNFETPNGLDKGEHHSTAYDMAVITCYAIKNETFTHIINTRQVNIKSDRRTYTVVNKNRLLNEYDGAIGVKTGFTGKAGNCFVGAAERDGMKLVSVVLGSGWGKVGKERKWIDTKNILNYGFGNYKYYDLCVSGDYIADIPVKNSYNKRVGVSVSKGITIPLNYDEKENIKAEIQLPDTIDAPVVKGDEIGSIIFKVNEETVLAECKLTADDNIAKKDVKTTASMLIKYWINPLKSDILKNNVHT